MKKHLILLSLLMTVSLVGCDNNKDDPKPDSGHTPIEIITAPPTYTTVSVSIHYQRNDDNYDSYALWIWNYPDGAGAEYEFNGLDTYGAIAAYPLSTFGTNVESLGYIVKSKGSWTTKDPADDRQMVLSEFEKNENGIYHLYLKTKDANAYQNPWGEKPERIESAEFTDAKNVKVVVSRDVSKVELLENNVVVASKNVTDSSTTITLSLPNNGEANFANTYSIKVTFKDSSTTSTSAVNVRTLYKTEAFSSQFAYDGNDLGATYTKQNTTFKVWSPVSTKMVLKVYNNGTPTSVSTTLGSNELFKEVEMTRGDKGVYSAVVSGDLAGKYYTYAVTNASYKNKETVDPYAKSTGVNGLRGMIVDFDTTNPEGWENVQPLAIDRKALTVYETHVADVTSSSTWGGTASKAKKFLGMTEEGTTYTKGDTTVTTGFDHIKELGVNAVQLLPIFDSANDEVNVAFNWGYNPSNYNSLDGSFASNPYDGYTKIKEFKQLVAKYNDAGINIIMDVVYNHMNGANGSNFDILMPGYYFRYNAAGALSNGSGCGNETASEMPMMRKFMIESTSFWAKEYKLGGFRFDLMGIHDIETMNQLTAAVTAINPNIVVYGEPWTGGTIALASSLSAIQANSNQYEGYGQFNDQMRDALIKGGLNAVTAKGWVTNNLTKVAAGDMTSLVNGIKGITQGGTTTISDPDKTVNYVTCHDNYTLYDRIVAAGGKQTKKMNVLANSVVFTSQGTTFMLAGDEFARTKGGNENSYDASYAVNQLDYALKITNASMVESYKKLISLKQSLSGLHLDKSANTSLQVNVNDDYNMISYEIEDKENNRTYKVIHVNGRVTTPLTADLSGYTLYLDTIDSEKVLSSSTALSAYETIIAYK